MTLQTTFKVRTLMFDLFYLLVKSLAKPRDSYKKFPVNNSLASSSNTIEALSWHISTYLLLGKTCNFFWIPSGPSACIMAQILVYWLSKLANNLWYVNLYLLRPLQAWPQQKTQIYNKSKCLPEIRGLSCTQKTVIPMSPKILEHPSASTEPFPKQVFERVFNEKLNSI